MPDASLDVSTCKLLGVGKSMSRENKIGTVQCMATQVFMVWKNPKLTIVVQSVPLNIIHSHCGLTMHY